MREKHYPLRVVRYFQIAFKRNIVSDLYLILVFVPS